MYIFIYQLNQFELYNGIILYNFFIGTFILILFRSVCFIIIHFRSFMYYPILIYAYYTEISLKDLFQVSESIFLVRCEKREESEKL